MPNPTFALHSRSERLPGPQRAPGGARVNGIATTNQEADRIEAYNPWRFDNLVRMGKSASAKLGPNTVDETDRRRNNLELNSLGDRTPNDNFGFDFLPVVNRAEPPDDRNFDEFGNYVGGSQIRGLNITPLKIILVLTAVAAVALWKG